jgi:hypothetical protein
VCDPRSSSTSCLTSFLPTSASTSCLHWQASSSSFQHTPPPFDKPRPPALLVTHRRSTPGWRLGTKNMRYKPWISSLPPPSRQSKPNIHHQAPSPLSSLIHGPVRRHHPASATASLIRHHLFSTAAASSRAESEFPSDMAFSNLKGKGVAGLTDRTKTF